MILGPEPPNPFLQNPESTAPQIRHWCSTAACCFGIALLKKLRKILTLDLHYSKLHSQLTIIDAACYLFTVTDSSEGSRTLWTALPIWQFAKFKWWCSPGHGRPIWATVFFLFSSVHLYCASAVVWKMRTAPVRWPSKRHRRMTMEAGTASLIWRPGVYQGTTPNSLVSHVSFSASKVIYIARGCVMFLFAMYRQSL